MATEVYTALTPNFCQTQECGPKQCVKGDSKDTLPVPYHESLENTSHTVLQVQKPDSPSPVSSSPNIFSVNIFNGSKGRTVRVIVRSTDTIAKLQKKLQKLKPDMACGNLIYNGKPLQLQQTLTELQVQSGSTFMTYQKCHGG